MRGASSDLQNVLDNRIVEASLPRPGGSGASLVRIADGGKAVTAGASATDEGPFAL